MWTTSNIFKWLKTSCTISKSNLKVISSSWWSDDLHTTERMQLESITSHYRLYQIINETTHILPSFAFCNDLIFTNKPSTVLHTAVHPLLHHNCYCQIIFAQINLKVYYPQPYKRLLLDYKKANTDPINLSIKSCNWEITFNSKDITFKWNYLMKTLWIFSVVLCLIRLKLD